MKVYSDSLFEGLKGILKEYLWNSDDGMSGIMYGDHELLGHIQIQHGNDEVGYYSFCEGFAMAVFMFNPYYDYTCGYRLSGVDKQSNAKADEYNEAIEKLFSEKEMLQDLYSHDTALSQTFPTVDSLVQWWETGYHDDTIDKDGSIRDKVEEYFREYWTDAPAFVKVCIRLDYGYGTDFSNTATVRAIYNDDLAYGRECVNHYGLGKDIGDHYIYERKVTFDDEKDLLVKVAPLVDNAFSCIGGERVDDTQVVGCRA